MSSSTCPICAYTNPKASKRLEGYQEGLHYDVLFCPDCDTAFVDNRVANDHIYDLIYENAGQIGGYYRYQQFRHNVKTETNPLSYLASQEGVYWTVLKSIRDGKIRTTDQILEVGCGLGYLTYALRQEGYQATGVDISPEAIAHAEATYGPYYEAENIVGMSERTTARYDVIIMTELIEHLEDPFPFIEHVRRLLTPTGHILITTPNKSYLHKEQHTWQSDLPPVHFWWFSEQATHHIAQKLGMRAELIDFSEYNRQTGNYQIKLNDAVIIRRPTFGADGQVLHPVTEPGPLVKTGMRMWSVAKRVLLPLLIQDVSKSQTLAFRLQNG